jgi:hypothetical protein
MLALAEGCPLPRGGGGVSPSGFSGAPVTGLGNLRRFGCHASKWMAGVSTLPDFKARLEACQGWAIKSSPRTCRSAGDYV